MNRIGIVSAIPDELRPLIRDWSIKEQRHEGRIFRFFEEDRAVALCGGIGYEAGVRAAEAMIFYANPDLIIAGGIAGALKPEYETAATLQPAIVIDGGTGAEYRAIAGNGSVVTSRKIASPAEKRALASKFGADIVDMEGAAVASVAERHNAPLLLAKSVSDELDFQFPPLHPFVDGDGRFQKLRFTMHAAVHPGWWPQILSLKRRSDAAAEALAVLLRQLISQHQSSAL